MSGRSVETTTNLTRNQDLVLGALSSADGPMSAYGILDQLREEGLRAPLQVYRALEKLVDFGLVHRLESLNAFVACSHPQCDGHRMIAFAICDICGQVTEITGEAVSSAIGNIAVQSGFKPSKSTVELRGICAGCHA